jgi:poly-gamma-glutamate capsule biosynthesis protein CapA/YwtB (metallophosphatase superfamily)
MGVGPFSLSAVGDLVPSKPIFNGGVGRGKAGFEETLAVLRGTDIAFGDLEMPLSTRGVPKDKGIAFRGAPALAADLAEFSFSVLSLANNHSLDYGYEALEETMRGLETRGIAYVGAGVDLADAERSVTVEAGGTRVGFVAWTCLLPVGSAAGVGRPGHAPIRVHSAYEVDASIQMEEPGNPPVVRTRTDDEDLARALARVAEIKGEVDFLAVSIHWGYGAGELLAEYQQPLGHALVDAGADVVLGNHVHAVHGVEAYKGKAILYSPGNFVAQQPRDGLSARAIAILDEMSHDGYVARIDVEAGGAYDVRLVPTVTDEDGLPIRAAGEDFTRITERLSRLSSQLGTDVRAVGDEVVVSL